MSLIFISVLAFAGAFYPGRAALSGRLVAIFCGLNCLTYTLAMSTNDFVQLPTLERYANAEPHLWSGEVISSALLLALGAFMAFYRRDDMSAAAHTSGIITVPPAVAVAVGLYTTAAGIYMWSSFGWDDVFAYRRYGSLRDLHEIYRVDPLGKLVASTYDFVILALVGMAIFLWNAGRRFTALSLIIPLTIALLLGLAGGSRFTAVFMVTAGACFYLTNRRLMAIACATLAVVLIGYSLEARTHTYLGLDYVAPYLEATLENATFLAPSIANLSMGLLVTSSAIEVAVPNAYSLDFKVLSFMPSINLIDGFQAVKQMNEQRVSYFEPFSTFGEAWVFGAPYYIYLWLVLLVSGRCVNSSIKYGRFWHALLLGIFLIGLLTASQYPVRNSLRLFYIVILARLMIGWGAKHIHARAPAAHNASLLAAPPAQNAQPSA